MLSAQAEDVAAVREKARKYFAMGREVVGVARTNPAASLYYYQALLEGEAGEWG